MRKIKRSTALHAMLRAGIAHPKRARKDGSSYFAAEWRRYIPTK